MFGIDLYWEDEDEDGDKECQVTRARWSAERVASAFSRFTESTRWVWRM